MKGQRDVSNGARRDLELYVAGKGDGGRMSRDRAGLVPPRARVHARGKQKKPTLA